MQHRCRDHVLRPGDSGWFFSSGTEDSAYMGDASNMTIVPIQTILGWAPELEGLLLLPPVTLLRRRGEEFVIDEP